MDDALLQHPHVPESSPITSSAGPATRAARSYHLRDTKAIRELDYRDFEKFFLMGVDSDNIKSHVKTFPPSVYRAHLKGILDKPEAETYSHVATLLESISTKYCALLDIDNDDLIGFVVHEAHSPRHHPHPYVDKQAQQKPDIYGLRKVFAATWKDDIDKWIRSDRGKRKGLKPSIALPLIDTFIEGKSPGAEDPMYQAAVYGGSLLQARPDLAGVFVFAYSPKWFRLLWCDCSAVYSSTTIPWEDKDARAILFRYIHFLYNPPLIDPTIVLHLEDAIGKQPSNSWEDQVYARSPVWRIRDTKLDYEYETSRLLNIGEPWSRMNRVSRSERYGPTGQLQPGPPVVIKDSYPKRERVKSGLKEGDILDAIHSGGKVVLGIITKISDFIVQAEDDTALSNIQPEDLEDVPSRMKYRLILEGVFHSSSLSSCLTVLDFLQAMFDALASSRFIHEKRQVLHRDLSPWNILLASSKPRPDIGTLSEEQPTFIGSLLAFESWEVGKMTEEKQRKFRQLHNWPTCVLIDFDNAKLRDKSSGANRTGSAAFTALERLMGAKDSTNPSAMPKLTGEALNAYIRIYGKDAYERGNEMHTGRHVQIPDTGDAVDVRSAPRHDAESCFWIIVYWFLLVVPRGADPGEGDVDKLRTAFDHFDRHNVTESDDRRLPMVRYGKSRWGQVLHPGMVAFAPFLESLTNFVRPSYSLVVPAVDEYNVHEALQRLILKEIFRLRESDPVPINSEQRVPEPVFVEGFSSTRPTNYMMRQNDEILAGGSGAPERAPKRLQKELQVESSPTGKKPKLTSGGRLRQLRAGAMPTRQQPERKGKSRAKNAAP